MSIAEVLLPVFVHVLLVFILLFWKDREQTKGIVAHEFGFPILFYAVVALALPLRQTDLLLVLLSWVFVVLRYVHAGVLVTSNNARQRALASTSSALVLLVMWIIFAWKILRVV